MSENGNAVNAKATRFTILKTMVEYHEKCAKNLKSMMVDLSGELYDEMLEDGIKELRIASETVDKTTGEIKQRFVDGRTRIVKPEEKYKGSITEANQQAAFAWLRENKHGTLIKETVYAATLSTWITELKAKNLPLPPANLISVFTVKGAKISLARK